MPILRIPRILMGALLAFGVMPVAAAQRFAEVATAICFRQVAGEISFGRSDDAYGQLLDEAGLMSGLHPGVMERIGRAGIDLFAQSILGGQPLGKDYLAVAIGGRMAGCRTVLLSEAALGTGEDVAASLTATGWTEVPATQRPETGMFRRMFVRRDASSQPFLLNLYAGKIDGSQVQLVSTVWPVPENVTLPEGL